MAAFDDLTEQQPPAAQTPQPGQGPTGPAGPAHSAYDDLTAGHVDALDQFHHDVAQMGADADAGRPQQLDPDEVVNRAVQGGAHMITHAEYMQQKQANDSARQQFIQAHPGNNDDIPYELRASDDERALANLKGTIDTARAKLGPAAASATDEQILQVLNTTTEQKVKAMMLTAGRNTLGQLGGQLNDDQVLNLIKQQPAAYLPEIAKLNLPNAAQDARTRILQRQDTGKPASPDDLASDPDILELQRRTVAAKNVANNELFGDLQAWANSWSFGIIGLASKYAALQQKGELDAGGFGDFSRMLQAHEMEHPYQAAFADALGYASPGGPARLVAKTAERFVSGPAVRLGLKLAGIGAEDALGLTGRLLTRAAAGAIDNPLMAAGSTALEGGNASQILNQINPLSDEGQRNYVAGAAIGSGFALGNEALNGIWGRFKGASTEGGRQHWANQAADAAGDTGMSAQEAGDILGLDPQAAADQDAVAQAFRKSVKTAHPDAGGAADGSDFQQVVKAKATLDRLNGWGKGAAAPAATAAGSPSPEPQTAADPSSQDDNPPAETPAPAQPAEVPQRPPEPATPVEQPAPAEPPAPEPSRSVVKATTGPGAEGSPSDNAAAAGATHPPELADAHALGEWYGKTFNDAEGAPAIEAMASMAPGKYVLADVPVDQADPNSLQANDVNAPKVARLAQLPADERANLPPAILVPSGQQLVAADGAHRVTAAKAAGDATVRAYVPEKFIGQKGITAATASTASGTTAGSPIEAKKGGTSNGNQKQRLEKEQQQNGRQAPNVEGETQNLLSRQLQPGGGGSRGAAPSLPDKPTQPDKFFIYNKEKGAFVEAPNATPVPTPDRPEIDAFAHRQLSEDGNSFNGKGFNVSDGKTGAAFTTGHATKRAAIESFQRHLPSNPQKKLQNQINHLTSTTGVSPRWGGGAGMQQQPASGTLQESTKEPNGRSDQAGRTGGKLQAQKPVGSGAAGVPRNEGPAAAGEAAERGQAVQAPVADRGGSGSAVHAAGAGREDEHRGGETAGAAGGRGADRGTTTGHERQPGRGEEDAGRSAGVEAPARAARRLAEDVSQQLDTGEPLTAIALYRLADRAFGGTQSAGIYQTADAYEGVELGVNKWILAHPNLDPNATPARAAAIAAELEAIKKRLPTQTRRSEAKDTFQQFSTPPDYSYAAAWVAKIGAGDRMLEPSAGTGNLAVWGLQAGAKVTANEIDPRRADILQAGLPGLQVLRGDAEQIHNTLPAGSHPSVVLMNPPFSRAGQRLGRKMDTSIGAQHIEAALKVLQDGGRLVAIVGRGMAFDAPTFRKWWQKIRSRYDVLANVAVGGDIYAKYGTSFETRLLVIDKQPPTPGKEPIAGDVQTAAQLIDQLKEVRDARRATAEQLPIEQSGGGETAATESGGEDRPAQRDNADAVGAGRGAIVDRGQAAVSPGVEAGRPAAAKTVGGNEAAVQRSGGGTGVGGAGAAGATGARGGGPAGEAESRERAAGTVELEHVTGHKGATGELSEAVFEQYRPQRVRVAGAVAHPSPLVQSAAMASVEPPAATYSPTLPPETITKGVLSDAQLESVIYAGQAHQRLLEDGTREGYFIGDGTGVGKGREIMGIIADNWYQGRRKAIWVSESRRLFKDAQRDVAALGLSPATDMLDHGKVKVTDPIKRPHGVLFTGYATLKRDLKGPKSRVNQIVNWVGSDFDGALVFDEAHNLKNTISVQGARGSTQPSETALAAAELQKLLPKARVVYVSATGATEPENLAYASRLGLWGKGTAFNNATEFVNQIKAGGVAAMELVARDMKATGSYIARSLSFDGIRYDTLQHVLSPEQRLIYDRLAEAWQVTLQNINTALGLTAGHEKADGSMKIDGKAKSAAMSAFWGAHQRFFNQVITSLQMPSVINDIERILADGVDDGTGKMVPASAVLQLVNTNEAATERAIGAMNPEEDDFENLDLTPRQQLIDMVKKSFPVTQYEEYLDGDKIKMRPVMHNGVPVENREAVKLREQLVDDLGAIKVPDGPLEMLLNHFGVDKVAENTGRTRRLVWGKDEQGNPVRRPEPFSQAKALADVKAFQDGRKHILVFSQAGGTGASYHADAKAGNQTKRVHYLVQAGWIADKAVQGFGRTHRSNEVHTPVYKLVTTDLKGQKRFISTIARRLDQLGALTKGERKAGAQGIFKETDNLESKHAKDALTLLYEDLLNEKLPGMTEEEFTKQTGLNFRDGNGEIKQEKPPVTQFLNRLLSMSINTQNHVFDEYMKRLEAVVEHRAKNGTLDTGVETVKADRIKKLEEAVAYTDPKSGAQTKYVKLELANRNKPVSFRQAASRGGHFVTYEKSGRVYALADGPDRTDSKTGAIVPTYMRTGPRGTDRVDREQVEGEGWRQITGPEAEPLWAIDQAKVPEFNKDELHLITGAVLPIWNRLRGTPRVYRLQTDDGERMLGRVLPAGDVGPTLKNLGLTAKAPNLDAPSAQTRVMEEGHKLLLDNNWTIKRSKVNGDWRMEITGAGFTDLANLKSDGAFTERIGYDTRVFIPTGDAGLAALAKVMKYHKVVDVVAPATRGGGGAGDGDGIDALGSPMGGPAVTAGVEGALDSLPPGPTASPRIGVSPLNGGQPKPLREIVGDFADALGKAPHLRSAKPGMRGNYYPNSTRTAIRYAGDLATLAHELAGHYLDDKHGVLTAWSRARQRSPFDAELIPQFSQHGSVRPTGKKSRLSYKRAEGLAEFVRALVVNPAAAQAAAPKFYAYFKSKIGADDFAKLTALSEDVRRWAGLSIEQRVGTNIRELGDTGPSRLDRLTEPFKQPTAFTGGTWLDKASTALRDSLTPVMKAIDYARDLRGITDQLPSDDARMLIRLVNGHAAKFEDMMERGLVDADLQRVRDPDTGRPMNATWLFDWADQTTEQSLLKDVRAAAALAVSQRVVEKSGQVWQAALDEIAAIDPADPKYAQKVSRITTAANERMSHMGGFGGGIFADNDMAADAIKEMQGDAARFSKLQEGARRYREWARTNLQYLVDKGWMTKEQQQEIEKNNQQYAAMHRIMDEIAPELGSKRTRGGRLGSMDQVIHRFKGSTREIENPYVNLLQQTSRIYHEADRNAALDAFIDLLRSDRQLYDGPAVNLDQIGSRARAGDADTIKVKHAGKTEHWQFERNVFKALKGWGEIEDPSWVNRLAQLPRKITTAAVTHVPPFMIRHAIRLSRHSAVVSSAGMKPWDMLRGYSGQDLSAFKLAGGAQFGEHLWTRGNYHQAIAKRVKELAKDKSTLLAYPRAMANIYRGAVHASDNLARVAGEWRRAYKLALGKGYNDTDAKIYAGSAARDLMDYAVAGTAIRKIGRYVPFMNARARGIFKTFEAAAARPRASAFRWAMFVVAPALAAFAYAATRGRKELDEYNQLPDWRRDMFDNFKVGHVWLSIPRPYELGVMASGMERAASAAAGEQHAGQGWFHDLLRSLLPADDTSLTGPLHAWIETQHNWADFFGRHIIPPDEEQKNPQLRHTEHASRLGQILMDAMNAAGFETDARKIDFFLHESLGGTGLMAEQLSDLGRKDRPPLMTLHGTIGLTSDVPAFAARDVQWVYDKLKELGLDNSGLQRQLTELVNAQRSAPSMKEKDEAAQQLREWAAEMRAYLEANGADILHAKSAAFQGKVAARAGEEP